MREPTNRLQFFFAIGLSVAALAFAACSSGSDSPASTPADQATSTPVPTIPASTPAPANSESNDAAGIRAYAETVDAYLQNGQTGILTSRLMPGLTGGNWRSEGGKLEVAMVGTDIMNFGANARPDLRDQYGDGAMKVWGFGNTPENAHILITAITRRSGGTAGAVRAAIDFRLSYCTDNCPTKNDKNRWTITSVTSAYVLAEDWLYPGPEGRAFLGQQYEVFRRKVTPTTEMFEAARNVAAAMGGGAKAMPDCIDSAGCVSTTNPGPSVDLGIMRLSFRAPVGDGSGAAVYAGKQLDGTWGFWFGTQQGNFRLVDLPGDLLICSGADTLNVRATPAMTGTVVAALKDGQRVRAERFALTQPGALTPNAPEAEGWYRVSSPDLPSGGWVSAKFTTDARLGNCDLRNAIER